MHKTYGCLALLSFGFVSLACPTRPLDRPDGPTGGHAGSDEGDGSAGTDVAGRGTPGDNAGAAAGNGGAAGSSVSGAAGVQTAGSGGAGVGGAGIAGSGGVGGAAFGGATGGLGGAGGKAGAGGGAGAGAAETGGAGGVGGAGASAGGAGGCASPCGSTQTCVGSKCLLTDGQQCTLAGQCASGACTPFYQDVDGDGYGAGPAVGFCGTSTPVGYSAQSGDCCDSAPNLAVANLIHPGATFQITSAGGVCGVTWDYNCDGTVETSLSAGQCDPGATYPTCAPQLINYAQSYCGTVQQDFTCMGETVSTDPGPGTMNVCAGWSNGPRMLGCR